MVRLRVVIGVEKSRASVFCFWFVLTESCGVEGKASYLPDSLGK